MAEAFSRAGEVAVRELSNALERTASIVEKKAKEYSPINYGNLRGSIHTEGPTAAANNIQVIVGTNTIYAPYMEYGTRPHFPPVRALQNWARHKLGDERLAFPVARAISRRGLQGRLYFRRARDESQAELDRNLKTALTNIVSHLAKN